MSASKSMLMLAPSRPITESARVGVDQAPAHVASGISRRSILMSTAVSVASLASSTAIAEPVLVGDHPDADLIALAKEAIALDQKYEEATARVDELDVAYFERASNRPPELYAKPDDGRIPHIGFEHDNSLDDRKLNCWCVVQDADALRVFITEGGKSREFIGTDQQWEEFKALATARLAELGSEKMVSPPEYDHLWAIVDEPELRRRAEEILRAYEHHAAECERFEIELGIEAANNKANILITAVRALCERIEKTKAMTLEGIRAKAFVLAHISWGGTISWDQSSAGDRLVASMVSDLTGLPDRAA